MSYHSAFSHIDHHKFVLTFTVLFFILDTDFLFLLLHQFIVQNLPLQRSLSWGGFVDLFARPGSPSNRRKEVSPIKHDNVLSLAFLITRSIFEKATTGGFMKTRFQFCISLFLFCIGAIILHAETFDFETAAYGPPLSGYITQTVSGITITVIDQFPDTRIDDGGGMCGTSGIVAYACAGAPPPEWMSMSFSQPVNITSLRAGEVNQSVTTNWVFTPNTGSPKTISIDGNNGTTATLNFNGITSVVMTRQDGGRLNFLIDNVVFDASLPVGLVSFSARAEGQTVVLEWITESETDNLGFILERTMGTDWQTIASYQTHDELKGQGNTSSQTEYTFTDQTVESGKEYSYRLSDVSTKGEITVYASLSIKMDKLPETTEMKNAYPNPFNPETYIAYQLSEDTDVNITVFDMIGRHVKKLYDGRQLVGSYHVYWNAMDETGNKAPSGGYIIQMKTEKTRQVQKVMLMK
jgi:hypothetical protein